MLIMLHFLNSSKTMLNQKTGKPCNFLRCSWSIYEIKKLFPRLEFYLV